MALEDLVKIGILSNSVSGMNRDYAVDYLLDEIIEEERVERQYIHERVGEAEEIKGDKFQALMELYKPQVKKLVEEDNVDILTINGGDGTFHLVTSLLIHMYEDEPEKLPAVVHLRGGTINYIADSTGVPKRSPLRWIPHKLGLRTEHAPEYVLRRLIKKTRNMRKSELRDNIEHFRLLKVDDNIENQDEYKKYGLLAAFGAPANFLDMYYDEKTGKPDAWKAFKMITKGIACSPTFLLDHLSPVWNYVPEEFKQKKYVVKARKSFNSAKKYVSDIVRKVQARVELDGSDQGHSEYTGLVPTSKDISIKITPLRLRVSKGIDRIYRYMKGGLGHYHGIRAFGGNVSIPRLIYTFARVALPGPQVKEDDYLHNRQVKDILIKPRKGTTMRYSVEGNMYDALDPVRITPSEETIGFLTF